jgi:hypothetical protein
MNIPSTFDEQPLPQNRHVNPAGTQVAAKKAFEK